ncbi:MAG TPA: DUF2851 family protein [Dehalococcoidia bacterium]|nr:DUF2851 family protein [Dehalococcoidia bacterium]
MTSPAPTEALLHDLWAGQRFPASALVTRQGVPVRVLHRGRRGRGPGPDFRGAVIAGPSGLTLRGDVELHVRASEFRAHGHHRDPAYDGVILHVVFEDDVGADTTLRCGRSVPVVALAPWVSRREGEIERWLARPALWLEPCHDAPERLGPEGLASALDALGDARFERRAAALREAAGRDGPEQALYAAYLEALAYGGDRDAMRALARRLPWGEALRLLGGDRAALASLFLRSAGSLCERGARPRRGRPHNDPARRLEGLAVLLARSGGPARLAASAAEASGPEGAIGAFVARAGGGPALIGRSRAIELLVNAALPFLAGAGEGRLADAARSLYRRLPRPGRYGALAFLEAQLRRPGAPAVTARRQQGLLALHREWCAAGGCGRCPLSPPLREPAPRQEAPAARRR